MEKLLFFGVKNLTGNIIPIIAFNHDTILKVKELIQEQDGMPTDQQRIIFAGRQLENDKTLKDYNIPTNGSLLHLVLRLRGGGAPPIENIKNEVASFFKNEKYAIKPIKGNEFIKELTKRDELKVNLIHFDLHMGNKENYKYFNNFKIDVLGGYYAIDDLNILKNYLESIKGKNIPFIVLSSGSSGKEVISICKNYSFIKEVIIFCSNYKYNEHYIKEFPEYVKKVLTSIESVYEYIKTFGADKYNKEIEENLIKDNFIFNPEEIRVEKQFQQCPVITSIEYDRCYFIVHKVYSHFFGNINDKDEKPLFEYESLKNIMDYLIENNLKEDDKYKLMKQFIKIYYSSSNDIFVERSLKEYTDESNFCYLFNRIMRNFEKGLISLSYYMGPLLFSLNKFVKENPSFAFSKNMKLYRIIKCSQLDYYQYKLNLGHIVCFPSITSTSSKLIEFKPSELSQKTNNNNNEEIIIIKMIFKYKHQEGNISPGIIVEDKKICGRYLSSLPTENEVILFPFTFARIYKIKSENEGENKIKVIKFEIINRNSYIEYDLKNNVEKRLLFSKLD